MYQRHTIVITALTLDEGNYSLCVILGTVFTLGDGENGESLMSLPGVLNVTVCIPAKDEKENLVVLLQEIDAVLEHPFVGEAVVVVFDDGSRDGTLNEFRAESFGRFQLRVLHSIVSVGKSSALQYAIDEALGLESDVIIMMDGDGQDDPSRIPDFLEQILRGSDVVNGRRTNREHSALKRASSRAFNQAVRSSTGLGLWDVNSGYKAFSRSAALALRPYFYGELHRVILVIAVWVGLQVGEVRVINRPRRNGKSKYGIARGWRGLFDLMTIQFLRRYHARPGHFFSGIGVTLIATGLAVFLWTVVGGSGLSAWLLDPIAPWATMGALAFGGVFISFGFTAELLVFLSKAPPTSVVRSQDSYPYHPSPQKKDAPRPHVPGIET